MTDVLDRLVVNTGLRDIGCLFGPESVWWDHQSFGIDSDGRKGSRGDFGSKPGSRRRILYKRRTGDCHGGVPDAGNGIKREKG